MEHVLYYIAKYKAESKAKCLTEDRDWSKRLPESKLWSQLSHEVMDTNNLMHTICCSLEGVLQCLKSDPVTNAGIIQKLLKVRVPTDAMPTAWIKKHIETGDIGIL